MQSSSTRKRAIKPTISNGDHDQEHALGTIEDPAPNGQQGDYRSQLEEANSNARAIFKIIEALGRVTSAAGSTHQNREDGQNRKTRS